MKRKWPITVEYTEEDIIKLTEKLKELYPDDTFEYFVLKVKQDD